MREEGTPCNTRKAPLCHSLLYSLLFIGNTPAICQHDKVHAAFFFFHCSSSLLPWSSILHAFCDEEEPPPSVMNYTRTEQPLSDCNPLSLSLWLQRLRAATNSSGQEPSAVWFRASNNTLWRRRKVSPTHRHRNHILFSQKFDSRDHLVSWLLSSSWKQINNSCLCSSRLLLLQSAEIGLDKSTQ